MLFDTAIIVGTGLIGTSLALAFKETKEICTIIGYDIDNNSLKEALKLEAIDKPAKISDFSKVDLIIFATPVESIKRTLRDTISLVKENTVVSDVGSTKYEIMQLFDSFKNKRINFIGGHPLAGSERSGPLNAKSDLFKDKKYVLIKSANCDQIYFNKFERLITKIGAIPIIIDAETHDEILSTTSHLPQIISYYLVKTLMDLKEDNENYLKLVGTGFKDTTRLSKSDPQMWIDIFKQNKKNILDAVENFEKELNVFKKNLTEDKYKEIKDDLIKISKFEL
ncbi:MAG: prephenate dehydrogenase/arogenate dehydrogenase family protein [Thermotogota bacterium]|nr:prephenate dehydrogenase/arogenate dehydrogenase family protein [Thermotogota bacterium]